MSRALSIGRNQVFLVIGRVARGVGSWFRPTPGEYRIEKNRVGVKIQMQSDNTMFRKLLSKDLTDVMIRVGLIAFVVVMCVRIFAPFMGLVLWALILAVALYPLQQRIAKRLGGRQGRSATLLVLAGILLIGVPSGMLGSSFASHVHDAYTALDNNTLDFKQPDPAVAEWPLVGEKIYSAWHQAATNLPAFLKKIQPQLETLTKYTLSAAASTAGSLFLFLGSLIVAGIMMAYGESGSQSMQRIISRLTGSKRGPQVYKLSTATIRSVATGVIGVAFIQALLLGVGFVLADIPAAGVLALIVLLLGIAQLPATIVTLPVIAYLWWSGDASTASNVFFTVYLLVAGMADNILKPLLLGRGVDAPMPVILLGAMGGMVSSGIIGLFVGAVLLAVGYQIFMEWVDEGEEEDLAQEPTEAAVAVSTDGE
jgi:predicted PurR-regulated permease PerM